MVTFNRWVDLIHRPFKRTLTRYISMILAISLSYILFFNPYHIADEVATLGGFYILSLMIALSAAFIHGIGFYPIFLGWKLLFSPYLSWLILLTFSIFIF